MDDCVLPEKIALQALFHLLPSSILHNLALIFPTGQTTFDNCTDISTLWSVPSVVFFLHFFDWFQLSGTRTILSDWFGTSNMFSGVLLRAQRRELCIQKSRSGHNNPDKNLYRRVELVLKLSLRVTLLCFKISAYIIFETSMFSFFELFFEQNYSSPIHITTRLKLIYNFIHSSPYVEISLVAFWRIDIQLIIISYFISNSYFKLF